MNRTVILGLTVALTTACAGGSVPGVSGQPLPSYWGVDGTCRSWEMLSDDTTVPYAALGVLQPSPTLAADGLTPIYTVEYRRKCIGEDPSCVADELLWSMSFSASRSTGTLLYAVNQAGTEVSFAPPIALTDREMSLGDTISTTSGGGTVTAEFMGLTTCDITWATWDECAKIHITDEGAGTGLAGDLWLANGWGLVAWSFDSGTDRWALERGVFSDDPAVCDSEGLPLL